MGCMNWLKYLVQQKYMHILCSMPLLEAIMCTYLIPMKVFFWGFQKRTCFIFKIFISRSSCMHILNTHQPQLYVSMEYACTCHMHALFSTSGLECMLVPHVLAHTLTQFHLFIHKNSIRCLDKLLHSYLPLRMSCLI